MFRSKRRAIVIPQLEHSRLAGTLALLWGNAHFDRPRIDPHSWVAGVTFHDSGYGSLDAFAIGEMEEAQWLDLMRASFTRSQGDPAAHLIVKLHVRRLIGNEGSSMRRALAIEFDRDISTFADVHGLPLAYFQRVDRITDFLDTVAFDFSFEQPSTGQVAIFPKNDKDTVIDLHYTLHESSIGIDPWPFLVSHYEGFVVGYNADGYPSRTDPVLVPYRIIPSGEMP